MWDLLAPNHWILLSAVIGLIVGSFVNVVVHRLPKMMEAEWEDDLALANGKEVQPRPPFNLLLPRSHCPSCKTRIKASHNIPVLSWLILRGKCGFCSSGISIRYPVVELGCSVVFALVAYQHSPGWQPLFLMALSAALISLALIDLDTFLLPDVITLPLVWLGLVYQLVFQPELLPSAVWGAVAGYMILWAVYHLFKLITGKEGMGYGDFKLLAAAGAWFGLESLLTVLLLSSVSGVFFGLSLQAIRKQDRNAAFPFGPAIVFGMLLWMFGIDILKYIN